MNHRTTLALLSLAALTVLAPLAAAATHLEVTSGKATPGTYRMTVAVEDFTLVAPTNPAAANQAGTGHIHYFINGAPAPGDYATPAKSFTFTNVKAGDVLSAELVNNDHSALSPAHKDTVTVTSAANNDAPMPVAALLAVGLLGLVAATRRRL